MDWKAQVELFEQLRREHEFGVGTIAGVAAKFGVHRRVVRRAIASALPPQQPQLEFTVTYMVAHRRFRDRHAGKLRQDPMVNPPRRVPLLARCTLIRLQNAVDKPNHGVQLRLQPRRIAMHCRQRRRERLANCPPMNPKLRRNTGDRADPKLMLPTELLE